MPYLHILEELLAAEQGALAAILLDEEGETISSAGRELSEHDRQVLGAYQGIYLRNISRHCHRISLGDVEELLFHFSEMRLLTAPIRDGYYLVLVVAEDGPVATLRRSFRRALLGFRQEL